MPLRRSTRHQVSKPRGRLIRFTELTLKTVRFVAQILALTLRK